MNYLIFDLYGRWFLYPSLDTDRSRAISEIPRIFLKYVNHPFFNYFGFSRLVWYSHSTNDWDFDKYLVNAIAV
ncbi:MAG: hypothetical protein MRERV_32c019 [Mycoplasmataceae bacterium RV_VA103A]|nr:MAG: hypothetical protein MRERV_32c019 [Mycoplasmataceae bacterium RV_VA103A]